MSTIFDTQGAGSDPRLFPARRRGYRIVDLDARLIERWLPDDERPEILDRELRWLPDGAADPLMIDLGSYFTRVLGP